MLEDDDWLKMDKPPEWLQPVEQEEYDEWTPPPRQPLLPPPPPVSRHSLTCVQDTAMSFPTYSKQLTSVVSI